MITAIEAFRVNETSDYRQIGVRTKLCLCVFLSDGEFSGMNIMVLGLLCAFWRKWLMMIIHCVDLGKCPANMARSLSLRLPSLFFFSISFL